MKAKGYFENIRAEVVKVDSARDMLERMRSREDVKAQGYEIGGGSVADADASFSTLQRMDFEQRLKLRVLASQAMVDEACEVLYGKSGNGGLAKLKGSRYADAICMYYCQAETWADMADIMQCSKQWCRELCNAGFAFIDGIGWANLRNS